MEIEIGDGRGLAVEQWGVPDGTPVLYAHGTPLSRLARYPYPEELAKRGIRLLTFDRPGYGRSTAAPDRRVGDIAADVAALADALGLDRFAVFGVSGGGPHALAVAARLPERVSRVAVLASTAPCDADGLEWTDGMFEGNRASAAAALAGRAALARHLAESAGVSLAELLPAAEVAVLGEAAVSAMLSQAYREAFRAGQDGWIDDVRALYGLPWGFDPATVAVPTRVWHGGRDTLVPPSHGRWLARRIPDAILDLAPEAGHAGHFRATPGVLDWLLAG